MEQLIHWSCFSGSKQRWRRELSLNYTVLAPGAEAMFFASPTAGQRLLAARGREPASVAHHMRAMCLPCGPFASHHLPPGGFQMTKPRPLSAHPYRGHPTCEGSVCFQIWSCTSPVLCLSAPPGSLARLLTCQKKPRLCPSSLSQLLGQRWRDALAQSRGEVEGVGVINQLVLRCSKPPFGRT